MGTMHYFNRDFNQNFNRDFKDSFSQASNKSFRPDHTQVITHTPMRTYFQYNSSELLETVQRRKRMLNAKVNITLAKKTPTEDNVTIDGVEYHVDYEDKRYRDLLQNLYTSRTGIRYEWFKEERGYKHWVLYNTEQFEVMTEQTENISYLNTCQSKTMPKQINFLHYRNREFTDEDNIKLEFPINLTSCFLMFKGTRFNNTTPSHTFDAPNTTTSNVIDFIGTFSHAVFKYGSQFPKGLDTSNAVKMDGMFYSAELRGKVKFPEDFSTVNVVSMEYMFARAFLNDELIFPKGFSTGNVRTMSSMFSESDVEILDLSHFETNSLEYVAEMFAYCEMLEEVTLDGWDFSQVVDFTGMFLECNDISCIYCSEAWDTSSDEGSEDVFLGCSGLPNYDEDETGIDAAIMDDDGGYLYYV